MAKRKKEMKDLELDPILEVFRDLGIEDARVRESFQQLGKLNELNDCNAREVMRYEPPDTRNNTAKESKNYYAELEPGSQRD